jgi:hypothetical protein
MTSQSAPELETNIRAVEQALGLGLAHGGLLDPWEPGALLEALKRLASRSHQPSSGEIE